MFPDLQTSCCRESMFPDLLTSYGQGMYFLHVICIYLENETAMNEKKAMHKKAKTVEKWMDEALRQRWRQRSEQYQLEREQEIKEKETECKTKREALASALEKTARSTSTEVEKINDSGCY